MTTSKIYGSLSLAAIVLLSSGKKETTEQFYNEQIKSLAGCATVGGDTIRLSDVEGKMLIVNFWASYDATSRINSHSLVTLSQEYADAHFFSGEGLGVVSVSLDNYISPLKKAIATDGTDNFLHICDLQGVDSQLAKNFDVNRPVNLLIDADGKIVARDFQVSNLRQTLEMLAVK